ncbi:l-Fucosyltransferase [Trichonephila clavipes]|nr:l-Fucosyltransferase [Trichonephila clavipes]
MGCHCLQYTVSPSIDLLHTMTYQRYVHDILQPHMLPLMQRLPVVNFLQDNTWSHTGVTRLRTVTALSGTARSQDLYQI